MVTGERIVQRARRQEDKEARRRTIIDAAVGLISERRFAEVKMSDIARAAGLAKGTVFLYFPTKETLFLDILEELLEDWLSDVDAALDQGKGRWTSTRVARIFTESLTSRPLFVRLLGLVTSVLEQNITVERMIAFKRRLRALLEATGSRLERRLDHLAEGEGSRVLMYVYAVVVGVDQMTNPGAIALQALEQMALEPVALEQVALDFETELSTLLGAVLCGIEKQKTG